MMYEDLLDELDIEANIGADLSPGSSLCRKAADAIRWLLAAPLRLSSVVGPDDMVKGLKIRISSDDLCDHCKKRSLYHRSRAADKENAMPDLQKSLDVVRAAAPTSVSTMNKSSNYHLDPDDPIQSLQRDITDHKNKSIFFEFMAEHLFKKDYILEEADLIRLEILKR
ncbi:MAG: hypothetical protein H7831_06685 [Magnetococcus sp. WYHC-3]